MFLPFSSNISLQIFRNRKFSILRISCSRSGRFYFRLRTAWLGMRRTTGTAGFQWSRFDVPRVFLALPQWPKSLKTLGTRLAPSPQHLKKEKGKGRKGEKWKLAACENRRKRACIIFTLSRTESQLETVDCETLHLFTSKIDKACEWTYNCLIGHWVSKYKWFAWNNRHRCCCKLRFQLKLAL